MVFSGTNHRLIYILLLSTMVMIVLVIGVRIKCKSLLVFLGPSSTRYPPNYISDFRAESSEGYYDTI